VKRETEGKVEGKVEGTVDKHRDKYLFQLGIRTFWLAISIIAPFPVKRDIHIQGLF
jgi:hypothetical protein